MDTIYIAMIEGIDSLFGFVSEQQRDEFADLQPEGAETGTLNVISEEAGVRLLAEERESATTED